MCVQGSTNGTNGIQISFMVLPTLSSITKILLSNTDKIIKVTKPGFYDQTAQPNRNSETSGYRPGPKSGGWAHNSNNRPAKYCHILYVLVTDMLHKSVGSTVGMRVGRCVSRGRDTTSV